MRMSGNVIKVFRQITTPKLIRKIKISLLSEAIKAYKTSIVKPLP